MYAFAALLTIWEGAGPQDVTEFVVQRPFYPWGAPYSQI